MGTKFINGTLDATVLKENGTALSETYLQAITADAKYANMAWVEDALSTYAKNSDVVKTSGDQWGIKGQKQWIDHQYLEGNIYSSASINVYGKQLYTKDLLKNDGLYQNGCLDLHPESSVTYFPFYMNDLAYLIEKGLQFQY